MTGGVTGVNLLRTRGFRPRPRPPPSAAGLPARYLCRWVRSRIGLPRRLASAAFFAWPKQKLRPQALTYRNRAGIWKEASPGSVRLGVQDSIGGTVSANGEELREELLCQSGIRCPR